MTTKLIILIVVGLLVFGALLCIIVKAWRYRSNPLTRSIGPTTDLCTRKENQSRASQPHWWRHSPYPH